MKLREDLERMLSDHQAVRTQCGGEVAQRVLELLESHGVDTTA